MSIVEGPFGVSAGDFYARGLGYVVRSYKLYDPDYGLQRDPAVYERIRRDCAIDFAMRYRKLLAAGRDWWLEPAAGDPKSRLLARILEDLLKELEYFDTARFNLAEAIIAGSRWALIDSDTAKLRAGGLQPMEWVVARRLIDVDKRRFQQLAVRGEDTEQEVSWRTDDADPGKSAVVIRNQNRRWVWQIFRPLQQRWEEIDRDQYVRHVYDDREDTLGFGGGLVGSLYTYWYAKEVALQHGLQYLERWSQGIVIAQVDTLRDGRASMPASSQRTSEWLAVLDKMRSRHVLVADSKDKLQVIDAPAGGWQSVLDAIRYLDGAMRVAILGAVLPTSQDATGGSYAMAEVQQDTTTALARFDMVGLEETLRRDLLGWLYRANYATFGQLGLRDVTLPYLRIREGRQDDHQIRADVIIKARQAGLEVRRDEAYAQLGLTPPTEGDAILPPMAQNAPTSAPPLPGQEALGAALRGPADLQREAAKGAITGPGHPIERPFAAVPAVRFASQASLPATVSDGALSGEPAPSRASIGG